jgi:hypothetical protein
MIAVASNQGLGVVEKFGEAAPVIGKMNNVHFVRLHKIYQAAEEDETRGAETQSGNARNMNPLLHLQQY